MAELGPYELDSVYCCDCIDGISQLPDESVDLVLTSPPYDNVREYASNFLFDVKPVASGLWRIVKQYGVIVWVVGDATIDGSETGTSFRQALAFMDTGFKLHDTMIYQKSGVLGGAGNPPLRYSQDFEYMFVFTKGGLKQLPNLIKVPSIHAGKKLTGTTRRNSYKSDGGLDAIKKINHNGKEQNDTKVKPNVWVYNTGWGHSALDKFAYDHPAIFPESLARDHIISWSNPGDVVLDPMTGSGTTLKQAKELGRRFIGFDISQEYVDLAKRRIEAAKVPLFVPGENGKIEPVQLEFEGTR